MAELAVGTASVAAIAADVMAAADAAHVWAVGDRPSEVVLHASGVLQVGAGLV
jgi:hypothetical protein